MSVDFNIKFILLGEPSVGKSCIMKQFVEAKYNESYDVTIGVEFGTKVFPVDGKMVKALVWDTAGQESFRSIIRTYYRDAAAVLLTFDLSRRESFSRLDYWLQEIQKNANRNVSVILIGNKCDIATTQVDAHEIEDFVQLHSLKYMKVSAKTGTNINDAFEVITKQSNIPGIRPTSQQKSTVEVRPTKKSGCCS